MLSKIIPGYAIEVITYVENFNNCQKPTVFGFIDENEANVYVRLLEPFKQVWRKGGIANCIKPIAIQVGIENYAEFLQQNPDLLAFASAHVCDLYTEPADAIVSALINKFDLGSDTYFADMIKSIDVYHISQSINKHIQKTSADNIN